MNWSGTTSFPVLNVSAHEELWREGVKTHTRSSLLSAVNVWLWQTVPPLLLVCGVGGNVVTVLVMRGLRGGDLTACLSLYFTALALSDLCLLLSSLLWHWPKLLPHVPVSYFQDLSCTLLFFLFYTSSLTSAWFLVVMTCQRVTSVVLPHRVQTLCTVRKGKVIVAVIVVIACAINVQIFFNYHMVETGQDPRRCQSIDEQAAHVFLVLDLTLASLLPFGVLVIGNSVLVFRTWRSVQFSRVVSGRGHLQPTSASARASSMTTTLLLTSVAFLLLTLPTCVFDVYLETVGYCALEIEDEDQDAMLTLVDTVCVLLWISNSAINFYLYILSGSKFRREAKRYLCCFLKVGKSGSCKEG